MPSTTPGSSALPRPADAGRLLRAEGPFAVGVGRVPVLLLCALGLPAAALYGLVMGSLGGDVRGAVYSCAKVPLLLATTTALCVPSFYVVNALLGLREDFSAAVRGILSAQGTLALTLASLAPVTAVLYASGVEYPVALLGNGAAFLVASLAAQRTLARHYRPLVARRPRHRRALVTWFALYAFVAIKAGWILRPFVGDPALPTVFVREERWQDDPYVTLFWTVVGFGATVVRGLVGH